MKTLIKEKLDLITYPLKRVLKKSLKTIPVISGADFGPTFPIFTFPIGGEVIIDAKKFRGKNYINKEIVFLNYA